MVRIKRRNILWSIFFLLLILLSLFENCHAITLRKPWVRITNFNIDEDTVKTGDKISFNVTIKNDRFLPVKIMIQTNLLDSLLRCKKEDIGPENITSLRSKEQKTIPITFIINETDIEGCQGQYNIQTILYIKKPLSKYWAIKDTTTHGIFIRTKLSEKDKVKIQITNISSSFFDNQSKFNVTVNIKNTGSFNYTVRARVDLVETSQLTITSESLENFDFLGTTRRELGNNITNISPYENKPISVTCFLQGTDNKTERFNIQAVALINIDDKEYEAATSSVYEVCHKQPQSLSNEFLLLIIGIIIGGVSVIGLLIAGFRIIYPIYYMKRIRLKEKKERFNKKRHIK